MRRIRRIIVAAAIATGAGIAFTGSPAAEAVCRPSPLSSTGVLDPQSDPLDRDANGCVDCTSPSVLSKLGLDAQCLQ